MHKSTLFDSFSRMILTVQLQVAREGISIVADANGAAASCIKRLGGGLSRDQLRWIFSSYPWAWLLREGVSPDAVPFEDGDDETHLWSELHEECDDVEIRISGIDTGSYAFEYLSKAVLTGGEEKIAFERGYEEFKFLNESVVYLHENGEAISCLQLADLFAPEIQTHTNHIIRISIMNDKGVAIAPEADSFKTGTYPLSRGIFMGLWNDPESLSLTRPFLEFGFSEEGTKVLRQAGFWSLDDWEKIVMETRLQSQDGIDLEDIRRSCGPANELISIAGSSSVFPVARIWSEIYQMGCDAKVTIEGGGSSAGAGRVCANLSKGTAVDIGTMSRLWTNSEAQERKGFVYDCLEGDDSRSAIKIDVAIDGLTIIAKKGGTADSCQEIMGGFTIDQLRWIFSGYNEEELEATGWDPSSLKNIDENPHTHLWSELDARCASEEILIGGDPVNEGAYVTFREVVLGNAEAGEDIAKERGYYEGLGFEIVSYTQKNNRAIAFVGYNYFYDNRVVLSSAAIKNDSGAYVHPSSETIGNVSYNPLSRSIYMNLLHDETSLRNTVPFLKFGFSHPQMVISTGLVPVHGNALKEMLRRLESSPHDGKSEELGDEDRISLMQKLGLGAGGLVSFVSMAAGGLALLSRA